MRLRILFLALIVGLGGCVDSKQNKNNSSSVGGAVAPVSDSAYKALSAEQQYLVTNKLLATLYKGMPVDEFFDIRARLSTPELKTEENHLATIRTALDTSVDYYNDYVEQVDEKYFYTDSRMSNTRAYPMALLYELPLSKEYYNRWMAYVLTNTILFSPAYELESVDFTDVETVYNRLVFAMDDGMTIPDIIYEHMISEENWRRFRSPEDNTREMMEIYLLRFRDDEVPLAAKACQNWSLTDGDDGYQLLHSQNVNQEPQTLLDRNDIISCKDFYKALVEHPQLIPAVTSRIVDYFFPTYETEAKESIVNAIIASGVQEFRDIFDAIIFSQEYLYNNNRVKTYEEAALGAGQRIRFYAGRDFFINLNDNNSGDTPPDMREMKQETMTYKLGRLGDVVPLDSLSLAYYHKSVRDTLLLDRRTSTDPSATYDGGWKASFINDDDVDRLDTEDFIHYLMLSTLSRKATADEVNSLMQIIEANGYETNRLNQALIVLDYASRLSEFYVMPTVQ